MDCIGSRSASCHIIEQVQWELATITVKVTAVVLVSVFLSMYLSHHALSAVP